MRSILPPDMEVPSSFESVGHIGMVTPPLRVMLAFSVNNLAYPILAHFNLRDDYLPYKNLIGQVLLDVCAC